MLINLEKRIDLPIDPYRSKIVQTINENTVMIIDAETGSGKTTRVCQFLLEETDYEIVVTQPRIIAATSVSQRVADEMNCELGSLVGYRTAAYRKDSRGTRCLFATDGLQMVRELTLAKQTIGKGIVLIIDEVHEWNQNIETLVAWVKKALLEGVTVKVVLMSADLDHEGLSAFFNNAPVIKVPGRCFPVTGSPKHALGICQKGAVFMVDEVKRFVKEGKNTLVFLPGKKDIQKMQLELEEAKVQAVILPLHAELEVKDQQLAFQSYSKPKVILSTNIAQTSVTIPDIEAVVDSGLENRIELVNNVETLVQGTISKVDCNQRAGRAGRVQEGEYVLCNDVGYTDFKAYPVPEIERSLLDQLALRLAGVGLDIVDLPFYHQPEPSVLIDAKKVLLDVEAIDAKGAITELGKKINKFPVKVMTARMILEAIKRKCLEPIITIGAIMETPYGSIKRRSRHDDPPHFNSWEDLIEDELYRSDYFAELRLYLTASLSNHKKLASIGIDPRGYRKAVEIRKQLVEVLIKLDYDVKDHNQNIRQEKEVLKCIAAGMINHLYNYMGRGEYKNGEIRKLAKDSVINNLYPMIPNWIVGRPFNLVINKHDGRKQTIMLVNKATAVDPMWFTEIAPHLITEEIGKSLYWSTSLQCVVADRVTIFNGQEISRGPKSCPWSEEALSVIVGAMMNPMSSFKAVSQLYINNMKVVNLYQAHYIRSRGKIKKIDSGVIRTRYEDVLRQNKVSSFYQLGGILDSLTIKLEELLKQ